MSAGPPAWPLPFADAHGGRLDRRTWWRFSALFALLHLLSLPFAVWTGNFDPQPNHDHVHVMRQVLEQGYPEIAVWPPGFGYYLALKRLVTGALGWPFWTGKVFLDVVPVVLSGVLSVLLAAELTKNRRIAVVSGVVQVAAPIFLFASAEGLAVVLFQPLFLAALLLVARTLTRTGTLSPLRLAGAGAVNGAACLVRGNPQFLLLALLPPIVAVARRRRVAWRRVVLALAVFGLAQAAVLAPWSLLQRRAGADGVFAAPVVYYAFFDGMRRHEGFRVSEALQAGPEPPHTLAGVVEFHRHWLAEDPAALAGLYAVKLARAWYLSDSGRWDVAILLAHAPIWLSALAGAWLWWRRCPRDPAFWLTLGVIVYMWLVSAAVSGLARYSAPVYGLLGLLAGVALLRLKKQIPTRRLTGISTLCGLRKPWPSDSESSRSRTPDEASTASAKLDPGLRSASR